MTIIRGRISRHCLEALCRSQIPYYSSFWVHGTVPWVHMHTNHHVSALATCATNRPRVCEVGMGLAPPSSGHSRASGASILIHIYLIGQAADEYQARGGGLQRRRATGVRSREVAVFVAPVLSTMRFWLATITFVFPSFTSNAHAPKVLWRLKKRPKTIGRWTKPLPFAARVEAVCQTSPSLPNPKNDCLSPV